MRKFSVEDVNNLYAEKQLSDFLFEYDPDEFWEEMGKTYLSSFKKQEDFLMNIHVIGNRLKEIGPKKILEVGCGFGRVLSALSTVQHVIKYDVLVGIEMSKTMIENSEKFYNMVTDLEERPRIIHGNAKAIPFPSQLFDTTYTHVCLTHIPPDDIPQVVAEINRVTSKYIIHVERFNWEYEHPNPHRWSHNLVDHYLPLGWEVLEYSTVNDDHRTRLLVLRRK